MMMNYPLGTSSFARKNKKKNFFWLVLVILVLFFYSQILGLLGSIFRILIYPIWITENTLKEKTINPFDFLASKKNLLIINKQLQENIEEDKLMLADRNLLLKENIELKELMGRLKENNMVLASVITKPNASVYDSLIVDAGKNLGIKKGDKVFVSGDILMGEIVKVNRKTSKVELYSSFGEKISVSVGLSNIDAIAIGRGGGNFEIKLPRGVDVKIGDPVFMKGINAVVLGSIEKIIFVLALLDFPLLFKSPINLFELQWVQISKSE